MIKKLEDNFEGIGEVSGFKYIKIYTSREAYLYKVKTDESKVHFEVFERKNTPICIDFENRVYSDTEFKETYPKAKDFGIWAWCYISKDRAINKFKKLSEL